ncbi:uncharacterized protein MAM_03817 [Metarhizium album ARSEF 1941]|uniref:SMODS and SLOG-associating 2TM effector domain-containing protein n=1 Tax=Metarhizium album (strain ARSEF 1941) TaxID=1081103 RepID=A0A0B2WPT5_METAS|nr:uncharacterized protein MAM_03817 [Metarhizium album ARSEF 1941]KHN98056.1 hypothetical protein MAM_03817 [Metarhizium album ARSEF 1941]
MTSHGENGVASAETPVLPAIPPSAPVQGRRHQDASAGKARDGWATPIVTTHDTNAHQTVVHHRFLSSSEWRIIANGIGGLEGEESDRAAHPSHWLWPSFGMPPGLYREVVSHKYRFYFLFHFTSVVRWMLMIAQLLIGASMTALGAMSPNSRTLITVLGAINTVVAGFLAILHNSGLPDRYRNDMAEFEEIEDDIKEVLNSGVAPADQTADQILGGFFDSFREAKSTVAVNMPANYASKQMLSRQMDTTAKKGVSKQDQDQDQD